MPPTNAYLKFIELIAYWEGSVNTSHLVKYFDISRQQAGKYIDKYQNLAPHNLRYLSNIKTYVAGEHFALQFSNGDVGEYLQWAAGSQPVLLPVEKLHNPQRQIDPKIVHGKSAAIH